MPTPPTLEDVLGYLGTDHSWENEQVQSALDAEQAAQAKVVRFPDDPAEPAEPLPYPADLAEALFRRVAHNLAVRALPLGVQATVSAQGSSCRPRRTSEQQVPRREWAGLAAA